MSAGEARSDLPLPPLDLALRVGPVRDRSYESYLVTGTRLRQTIDDLLPEDWTFEGKRVLDFGCGAGRVLRQFREEADEAEIWGCDIHPESVEWLQSNLSPPFHCFRNDETPPLPVPDGRFDLVLAMSVFTHIGEGWADWLLEMRRVLAPGGLLIATYLGGGVYESLLGRPYVDDEVGMLVHGHWRSAEEGGPWVFHSEWWLRRHWGPAFEVLSARDPTRSPNFPPGLAHSVLIARRMPSEPEREALLALGDDPRELAALRTEVAVLRDELAAAHARPPVDMRALGRRARETVLRTPLGRPARRLRERIHRTRRR